ncbi:MAG: hypothetical protein ABI472_06125 [Ginsengibacter sp.]
MVYAIFKTFKNNYGNADDNKAIGENAFILFGDSFGSSDRTSGTRNVPEINISDQYYQEGAESKKILSNK